MSQKATPAQAAARPPVNYIHDLLRDEGRSFAWLSGKSGFSYSHISRVANRHIQPSRLFRRRVADALGMPESRIWPRITRRAA